jgi:hypothetical protein
MPARRDNFSQQTIRTLAERACHHCSNPRCARATTGPAQEPSKRVTVGVGAHIAAAAPKGPRYDSTMSLKQRTSIDNAIWLCEACGALIDKDEMAFPVEKLHRWKAEHEKMVSTYIRNGGSLLKCNNSQPALGRLIVDQVTTQYIDKAATIDFRVTNRGGSDVMINKIVLEVEECFIQALLGHAEFSHIYDCNLSKLRCFGDIGHVDTAQMLHPGESDRFGIRVSAPDIGPVICAWKLGLNLKTNFGLVEGGSVEIWLPDKPKFVRDLEEKNINPLENFKLTARVQIASLIEEFGVSKEEPLIIRRKLPKGGLQMQLIIGMAIYWYSCETDFLVDVG